MNVVDRHVSLAAALPPVHAKPASIAQVALHPSPAAVPPSSHASAPIRLPSPHTAVAQNLALVLATVYVLPRNAALHVLWLAAGLVGLTVEKYDLRAGTEQGESGKAGGQG